MQRILIVKITSFGDLVHAQPLVWDLRRAFPSVRIDWAADASCADVVRWNPGVDRVIALPLRSFKRQPRGDGWRAIRSAIGELRSERYDAVIDIHGMYKSALVARLARSPRRFGYPRDELGEAGAAWCYTDALICEPGLRGVRERLRATVAQALGYEVVGDPRYGLRLPPAGTEIARPAPADHSSQRTAMLFHGTSADAKCWLPQHWMALAQELARRGYQVELPWGTRAEQRRAQAIADAVPGVTVLPPMSVTQCARQVGAAALVVGCDTGFVHLADALERPTVMVFVATSRTHYGVQTTGRTACAGDDGRMPSVAEVLRAVDRVSARPQAPAPLAASAPLATRAGHAVLSSPQSPV